MSNILIKFLLLFLVPLSLYVNFFVYKLSLWSYELKAFVIYSLILVTGDILLLVIVENIFKRKYDDIEYKNKYIDISSIAFLSGNIFWMFPNFRINFWYIIPLFKSFLIFLFLSFYTNRKFSSKEKLTLRENFFTIKKTKLSINKSNIVKMFFYIIFVYLLFSIILNYCIKDLYDPLKKSLEYFAQKNHMRVIP